MVEYWTSNREVADSTHTRSNASNLEQAAKPTVCSGQLSLLPSAGREMSSIRPSVADWGDGVSASCTVGPAVH